MTVGEIYMEALRLMFAAPDMNHTWQYLSRTAGSSREEYAEYLAAMPGSLNRCFADLAAKGIDKLYGVTLEPVENPWRSWKDEGYDASTSEVDVLEALGKDLYEEFKLPDKIAAYIPYFIKGDIYRNDEPNEASEARNWYEQGMETILNEPRDPQETVCSVYDFSEV